MAKKLMENIYIKFRMFVLCRPLFWDKFDLYMGRGDDIKQAYVQARYKADYSPDRFIEPVRYRQYWSNEEVVAK